MSMHLTHPSLTLNGKRKGKHKFRTAEQAKRARDCQQEWAELQKKWGVTSEENKRKRALSAAIYQPKITIYRGSNDPKIPSLNDGKESSFAAKKEIPKYTGDKMIGIATMHKSNSVPVFSSEEATDISKMRR